MPRRGRILIAAIALGATACAGDQDAEPAIPTVDFAPRLVVVATDDGLQIEAGEPSDGASVDPPSVPVGSVVEVRNADTEDHRITAGTTIDTGVLQPGDTTTVVITTEGDLDVREVVSGDALTITVTARTDGR